MQFEERQPHNNTREDQPSESDRSKNLAARLPPAALLENSSTSISRGMGTEPFVPPEVMSQIKRVAKFDARIFEGLLRHDDDMDAAVRFAELSSDGLASAEVESALAVIQANPAWRLLLVRLTQTATDDVRATLAKESRKD